MSNQYLIQSNLPGSKASDFIGYFIDASEGGSSLPKLGGVLNLNKLKSSENGNQLWTFIPAPKTHPGYFFIQSALPDSKNQALVIDIQGDSNDAKPSDNAPIDVYTNKLNSGEKYENQLWKVTSGSTWEQSIFGYGYFRTCFIRSYLKNDNDEEIVIDVKGGADNTVPVLAAALDVHHKKSSNTQNQEWSIVVHEGYSFSPTVSVTAAGDLLSPPVNPATITLKCRGFVPASQVVFSLLFEPPDHVGPSTATSHMDSMGISDLAGDIDFTFSNDLLIVDQPGTLKVLVSCNFYSDGNFLGPRELPVQQTLTWDGLSLS